MRFPVADGWRAVFGAQFVFAYLKAEQQKGWVSTESVGH